MRFETRPGVREDVDQYAARLGEVSGNQELEARFLKAVESTFQAICNMPGIGSPIETRFFTNPGVRKWPVNGFPAVLVFYRELPDCVEVLRVVDARQNWRVIL